MLTYRHNIVIIIHGSCRSCRCCCLHLLGVTVKMRAECAGPATRCVVSAPDFAVGTGGRVHKGVIRLSRAAPARARPGTSEIVWVSRCFFCLRDISDMSERCKGRFGFQINVQPGIIFASRADLKRSSFGARTRQPWSFQTRAVGRGLLRAGRATEFTGT